MKITFQCLLAAAAVLLSSCQTDFKEWRGAALQKGSGGACEVKNGVEMWSYGTPNRYYRIIGVIEDTRAGGIIPMARRNADIAAKAKAKGADGVIIIGAQKESLGTFSTLNATSTTTGNVNLQSNLVGNSIYTNGSMGATTNTFGHGVSANIMRATSQYLAFKYE